MPEQHFDFLIIGGGLAAASSVKELLRLEAQGSICVLAEEEVAPYDRPPLSKEFLLGELARDTIFLLREDFCRDHGVELRLGNPAARVEPAGHAVTAADGSRLTYGKLLLASGCQLRKLSIPGSELAGLYYLRTLAEAENLRAAAVRAGRAVIIGGGFIGLEVASVLAQLGLDVSVIHQADRLMEKFGSEAISSFFEELFASRGVTFIFEDAAVRLEGDGQVNAVVTKSGKTLPCDLAVAGIGVRPETSYLVDGGFDLSNGVAVNEYLEAGVPDVYAAGDIANFFDNVYGKQRRIEHWDNALRQGKLAAGNMAGGHEAFHHVSYFFSTVFGLTYECYGDMTDFDEVVERGTLKQESATVLYLKQGVLQSAFMLGRTFKERSNIDELIRDRKRLDAKAG